MTGHSVTAISELPAARAVIFDTTPRALAAIAGERLPGGYRRRLEGFRYGPGVVKLDWALSDPIPWAADGARWAGTVHVGGTLDEIRASEADVAAGRHPERPFVIVVQQSRFDPSRAPAGRHTGWAYCHVPSGSTVDMTDRIEAQLERFAPGFRDTILARSVRLPGLRRPQMGCRPSTSMASGSMAGRRSTSSVTTGTTRSSAASERQPIERPRIAGSPGRPRRRSPAALATPTS